MARKFHIAAYKNTWTVYETVEGGERAVSPTYTTPTGAQEALAFLTAHPEAARFTEPSPKPEAAKAALDALIMLRDEMNTYDGDLNDEANGGENSQSPTGDDYNALYGLVQSALIAAGLPLSKG